MSLVAAPPPTFTVPPMAAEVRIAPQRAQGSQDQFTVSDTPWTPPSRSQMMLATAPLFHPSEFQHKAVNTETVKSAVAQILANQPEGQPITDIHGEGHSFEAAAALAGQLKEAGFPARMVQVDQEAVGNKLSTLDGESVSRPAAALVVVEGGREPIYVDGAVRQWVADSEAYQSNLPSVFVGSKENYKQLMRDHKDSLRLTSDDQNTGNYHPGEFAEYLLGEGGGRTYLD